MSVATLERATETERQVETETWLVFQTIDDRFSLEFALLPRGAFNVLLWDKQQPPKDKLRHSAMGRNVPDAIYKLKRHIATSPFATDAEKEAAERIEVPG